MTRTTSIVTLSILSLLLLVILQLLWLTNSYEKAQHDFQSRCSDLFRTSVMAVRDSSVIQSIESIPADTLIAAADSIGSTKGIDIHWSDSTHVFKTMRRRTTRVEVFAVNGPDSLRPEILRAIGPRIQEMNITQPDSRANFVIRLGPDTLNMDTIRNVFATTLSRHSITNPFVLTKDQRPLPDTLFNVFRRRPAEPQLPRASIFADSIATLAVHINPFLTYQATISNVRMTLLREIAPQLAFSGFVTLLTFVSFTALFRNIRTQKRLLTMKNELVSNITHELKTPISTVSVALEALRNFDAIKSPRLAQEYLDMAQRELNRLTLLTDNILKTSLFEEKQFQLLKQPVDLKSIVESVLSTMRFVFEKSKAELRVALPDEVATISGDSTHITNVVYNLLDNALKYSNGTPHISVELYVVSDAIELSVADKGIGIPEAYHTRIYDKFFRVPSGNIHNVKGHGLGLNYVASVVELHQGTIKMQSKEGVGTTFTVRFPRLK